MAFNTPFKMWKRYEFNGGTSDPCIVSWPAGMKSKGEIREQYHHAIDIVPTVLDALGVEAPRGDQGPRPEPVRRRQHALQLRRREGAVDAVDAVLRDARLAGDLARRLEGGHEPPDDRRLEPLQRRRVGAVPHRGRPLRAAQPREGEPGEGRELQNLWYAEAGANGAFPLDDRSPLEILLTPRPVLSPPRNRYVYFPDTAEVPESQAVNVRNRSYAIGALVDIPAPGAEGVLFAHGSPFGGHALYVKDNRLHYVYNFVGMVEQKIVATEDLPIGEKPDPVGVVRQGGEDPPGVANGTVSLWYGDKKVGEATRSRPSPASS